MATESTKKTVIKKKNTTTLRKGVKPQFAMVCAAGEECFWVNDGQILSSLGDLYFALTHMSPEVYAHHVTLDRNDFADWIEFVLLDKKCALSFRAAKDQKTALALVKKAIAAHA